MEGVGDDDDDAKAGHDAGPEDPESAAHVRTHFGTELGELRTDHLQFGAKDVAGDDRVRGFLDDFDDATGGGLGESGLKELLEGLAGCRT